MVIMVAAQTMKELLRGHLTLDIYLKCFYTDATITTNELPLSTKSEIVFDRLGNLQFNYGKLT